MRPKALPLVAWCQSEHLSSAPLHERARPPSIARLPLTYRAPNPGHRFFISFACCIVVLGIFGYIWIRACIFVPGSACVSGCLDSVVLETCVSICVAGNLNESAIVTRDTGTNQSESSRPFSSFGLFGHHSSFLSPRSAITRLCYTDDGYKST